MVGLLRDVWQTVGLDVYVDPYGVLPTKYESGIIQARNAQLSASCGTSCLRCKLFALGCQQRQHRSGDDLGCADSPARDHIYCVGVEPESRGSRRTAALQCVPDTTSRASMGETADGGLYDVFCRDYGAPESPRFEAARLNFIRSCAGWVARTAAHRALNSGHCMQALAA